MMIFRRLASIPATADDAGKAAIVGEWLIRCRARNRWAAVNQRTTDQRIMEDEASPLGFIALPGRKQSASSDRLGRRHDLD
jgi:hypothetical protein